MTSNALKVIALILMLIDHVGAIFFPSLRILRVIGRLAFPIFIFLLNEGFFYTRSRRDYLLRLILFAFISEIPYDLAFYNRFPYNGKCNVFFTLALGMIVMICADRLYEIYPSAISDLLRALPFILAILCCFGIADMLHTDYGSAGVLAIGTGYMLKRLNMHRCIVFFGIVAALVLCGKPLEAAAFAALPLILLYNGKRGVNNFAIKMFFFSFYPLHLLLLFFISRYK